MAKTIKNVMPVTHPVPAPRFLVHKTSELQLLLSAANRIAMARTREELTAVATALLLSTFSAGYFSIHYRVGENNKYQLFLKSSNLAEVADRADDVKKSGNDFPEKTIKKIFSRPDPIVLNLAEVTAHTPASEWSIGLGKKSIKIITAVKLSAGDVDTGFLCLYATQAGSFPIDKFELLQALSTPFGVAVRNILLNEQALLPKTPLQQLQKEPVNQVPLPVLAEGPALIGSGGEMQKLLLLINQVAPSEATVLIMGETGTGKELVAQAIHAASPRKDKTMIKINCASLPATLIESELFGHERGSFTGATERKTGKFEQANNSTLFLDEIGEMPLELQVKLLRVLQDKKVERLGGKATITVNVRIIVATNRNLQQEVHAGRFRSDLYYRINGFSILVPPLRRRQEDIPALATHFMNRFSRPLKKEMTAISNKAVQMLLDYPFPGNVRELEHIIERSMLLATGNTIRQVHLPDTSTTGKLTTGMEDAAIRPLAEIERDYILHALKKCNGRVSGPFGAAAKLGLPATTLISKMQKLQIKRNHFILSQ